MLSPTGDRMRHLSRIVMLTFGLGVFAAVAGAQPPNDRKGDGPKANAKSTADAIIARMMAFDKNKDGKLTRDEITDERLLRLFDRADTNKDGVVTMEELKALAEKMAADEPMGGRGGPGARPGGRGRPGGGRGGPGGPSRPGGGRPPPRPRPINARLGQGR